ncbi:NRAMP family divalent metal transporter [Halomarina litorea]|uniref:NRAMP family divalent metal transporter n=1 Tax=Halomarina litorea TaxID=2961595 RepID=UPI0020C51FB6|nr:divalent metal cation transporter [Halomarina sp. BCD28]
MTLPNRLRHGFDAMGPSWLAGAIAAGPATMASLLTAGAGYGYALLWVVVLSALFGTLTQYLAARLGLLTERGIVGVVEDHLGDAWAWLLVLDVVLVAGIAQLVIMKGLAQVTADLTGVDVVPAGIAWAVLLAVGLAGGGYRAAELGAKLVVGGVVLAFVASLFVVPIDAGGAAGGLVPTLPAGSELVVAGVLGGAVHITLITMHSYAMRARGWTRRDHDAATADVVGSMGIAFGLYSVAIFLVAASVLSDPAIGRLGAAHALEPVAGPLAERLFLFGLLGAAVSTLGGNTVVPPSLLVDKLGWGTDVDDPKYRGLVATTALLSAAGVFVGGAFFGQLVFVLALGLVGTVFALAVVLSLLNDPRAVPETNGPLLNAAGGLVFAVVTVVVLAQLRGTVASADGPLDYFVLAFAAVVGVATLAVLVRLVRTVRGERAGTATRSD